MKQKIHYYFNPEDGSSLCLIKTKNKDFVGMAQCSEQDRDMLSEKTGEEIALHRATLRMLEDEKEKISYELKGLKKYYYSINTSKYFNKTDYAVKMLIRQIKMRENDIEDLKELINNEKEFLKSFMEQKAAFYNKVREYRKKDKNN